MQDQMIKSFERRALRAGLCERMENRVYRQDSLGIDDISGNVDFALASVVLHEVPDPPALFRQVLGALKPAGKFVVVEPKRHVSTSGFQTMVFPAGQKGFTVVNVSRSFSGHSVLLQKPGQRNGPENTKKTIGGYCGVAALNPHLPRSL